MIDHEGGVAPAAQERIGSPIDIPQAALAVIATTRCEWMSRAEADEQVGDLAPMVRPLFRLRWRQ